MKFLSCARLATERRNRDNRPVSLDTQCHVAQAVRKPLEPPQPAANGHLELEGFNLPPARQSAVRLKGAGYQIVHVVSLAMRSFACNEAQAPTGEMAVIPPSIKKSAPTTYAESSDAR